MLLDFFKRKSRSKKQSNDNLGKQSELFNEVTSDKQTLDLEKCPTEEIITVKEKISGEVIINGTGVQAIPAWASSWLRKNGTNSDILEEPCTSLDLNNKPDSKLNISSNPDSMENPELPTVDLVEPRNVEVREMVLRQIQNTRSVARYMCSTENLVEEQIRKSMERGDFNNLKGKGKPLKFEENPYEDPELRLPFKILKDAGFAPYWVEMGKQIDAEIAGCQMIFDKFLENLAYRKARQGYLMRTPEFELRLRDVLKICSEKLDEANKRIDKYNMIVPMYWLQRKKVDTDGEMAAFRRRLDEFLWEGLR